MARSGTGELWLELLGATVGDALGELEAREDAVLADDAGVDGPAAGVDAWHPVNSAVIATAPARIARRRPCSS